MKKQNRENNQGLIRRFTKRIRESGILRSAKGSLFHHREKSEGVRRNTALRKIEKKIEYEKLKKLGKV